MSHRDASRSPLNPANQNTDVEQTASSSPLDIDRGRVDLWYTFLDGVTDPELLAGYKALLGPEEVARHDRFVFPKSRHQYLVARALVRTALSQYVDVAPAAWSFATNEHGKPSVASPAGCRLRFNPSHTAGLAVCAVTADREIGVDVESIKPDFATAGIVNHFFAPEEIASLDQATGDARQVRFFQLWTLKEAFLKAVGLGLSLPLKDFAISLPDAGPPQVLFHASGLGNAAEWDFSQVRFDSRYQIALALHTADRQKTEIWLREFVPLRGTLHSVRLPDCPMHAWSV